MFEQEMEALCSQGFFLSNLMEYPRECFSWWDNKGLAKHHGYKRWRVALRKKGEPLLCGIGWGDTMCEALHAAHTKFLAEQKQFSTKPTIFAIDDIESFLA